MENIAQTCILVGGYSQPPKETAANFTYNILSCQLLVSKQTHCVMRCHFNTISPLTSDYLDEVLRGVCLDQPLDDICKKIQTHVHLIIANSVIHALRNAQERYKQIEMPD